MKKLNVSIKAVNHRSNSRSAPEGRNNTMKSDDSKGAKCEVSIECGEKDTLMLMHACGFLGVNLLALKRQKAVRKI